MNLTKLFRSKTEESDAQGVKVQRAETPKRSSPKPAKSRKAEGVKKAPKKPAESRIEWMDRFRQYLREVVYELRKVVWPSRKETVGSTLVVLAIVIFSGVYLGIVDLILSRFIRLLIG